MEQFLENILNNNSLPVVTAMFLGLIIAFSPCPLTTNILAIGFINKNIETKRKVFINGVFYTLGMSFSYFMLALIISSGANLLAISSWFQLYSEKILAPLLIIIGILLLNIIPFNIPQVWNPAKRLQEKGVSNYFEAFLLGALFALAFCPNSAVLYFGMLIPLTIVNASQLYLPLVFSITAGIPVIIFAWVLAYTLSKLENFYSRVKHFGNYFRKFIGVLFIGVGIYYVLILYL